MSSSMSKPKYIIHQLAHHLPFSVFGVMVSILALGFLSFLVSAAGLKSNVPSASGELFHVFHAAHVLLSAVASTAMFRKHDNSLIKAIVVGALGSVFICGVSDILLPYIGGMILGLDMHFHICIIEEPSIVYPFAIIGTIAGLLAPKSFENATEYSHSMHVFVSSVASILYLMAYGLTGWMDVVGSVFIITIIAVMIPCCLSDIAFPLACSHSGCHHPDVMEEDHVH